MPSVLRTVLNRERRLGPRRVRSSFASGTVRPAPLHTQMPRTAALGRARPCGWTVRLDDRELALFRATAAARGTTLAELTRALLAAEAAALDVEVPKTAVPA